MTKIKQSDFEGDTITTIEKPKTRAEKLSDFQKANKEAYKKACESHCMCSPSRAEMLLMDRYNGDAALED
jgi:aerobic-type carbon monoxide dehydrogenase small subunit (CoxS/CutS family)